MTDQSYVVQNDFDLLLKSLAPGGRGGAVLGGTIFLAAGSIYGAASLLAWAITTSASPLASQWVGWIWLTATAAFLSIVYMSLVKLSVSASASADVLSRTVGPAWWGVTAAILALVFAFGAASARLNDGRVWQTYSLCLFTIYGLAWLVTALASRKAWMGVVAAGCFATSMAAGFLLDSAALYLLFAVSLIGLLAIPGLVLVRRRQHAQA